MSPVTRVIRAADTRELPLVVGLIALLLAEGQWSSDANGLSPLGVLAAVGIALPLLWRHRASWAVLTLVVAGVFACMATLHPSWSVVAVSAAAIYSVALHGDRRRAPAHRAGGARRRGPRDGGDQRPGRRRRARAPQAPGARRDRADRDQAGLGSGARRPARDPGPLARGGRRGADPSRARALRAA